MFKPVLAVAALGFAGCAALSAAERPVQGIPVGVEAPPIDGTAWFTTDGKAPELSGKVYLVHFWFARWPWCVKAIPALKATAQKYAAQGFVLVAPSLDAEDKVKQFKEKQKIEEYILVADTRATAMAFGVESYPMMFLIGKDGKVAWKGEFENADMHKAIEAALAAKAPDAKAEPAKK